MSLQSFTQASPPACVVREVQEIIAGRVDARQIRQFLQAQAPIQLREALSKMPGSDSVQFRLLRTRLKPGRKLVAFFELVTGAQRPCPIAVTWADESPVKVLVSPEDPAFPQLMRLNDADYVTGLVDSMGRRMSGGRLSVTPLRYRPGQRHVLRIDGPDLPGGLFAKIYRDGTGASAIATARSFQYALTAWGGPARTARPYGYAASDRVALWSGNGGEALSGVIANSPEHSRTAGAALRVLHDGHRAAPEAGPDRGTTDVAKEGQSTARAVEHIEALRPTTGRRLAQLLHGVVGRLTEGPGESGHALHGDFKCDNILAGEDGLSILDFDRSTIGDPALDLGKFCADLRWWAAQADSPPDELIDAFAEGYGSCPTTRWERAGQFDLLFQLRAAGRRVTLHDEGWAERVDARVEAAAALASRQK
ncbi:MAG: aminoglycoside phosphotransferase family protein [Aeromicrobium sp.]